NDFGNGMEQRCAVWKQAPENMKLTGFHYEQKGKDEVAVEVNWSLPGAAAEVRDHYIIYGNGDVKVSSGIYPVPPPDRSGGQVISEGGEIPEMPRFGKRMMIPGVYSHLEWYGRGPHENYCDRNTAALTGIYQSTVAEQYFPYVRPQEYGYRTDVRWLALRDGAGRGWMILTDSLIGFSALHYTMEDLDQGTKQNYRHMNDLTPRDTVSLHVDYLQMGVGGDDSWGARPHPQYTLPYGKYRYSFIMRPLRGIEDLTDLARRRYRVE
ncbi:MAG: hypothetical protein JXA61_02045, partial [Bacteroidales bacterium]|nr:hypothetical protein [Bacteroidales bacterium]